MLLSGGANVHNVTMNREQLNVNTHFMDMQKMCVKTESEIQNFNFNIDCSVFVSIKPLWFSLLCLSEHFLFVCICLSIFRQIRIIYLQCSDVILDCKHPVSITHLYHVFNKRHLKDQCKIFDFFLSASISGSNNEHSKKIIKMDYYTFPLQKMSLNYMFSQANSSKPNNLQK